MAFFSGLRAAYDSLGSELSKNFDSSRDSQAGRSEEVEIENTKATTVPEEGRKITHFLLAQSTPRGHWECSLKTTHPLWGVGIPW